MLRYATIFRTHVWDRDIAALAERARRASPDGSFVVAADETHGPLDTAPYPKLAHTADFSAFGLPRIPPDRALWWNADYVLIAVRQALPHCDAYVMLEYDAHVAADLKPIVQLCADQRIGLVAHQPQVIKAGDHWAYPAMARLAGEVWWTLLPFLVISGPAIDALSRARRQLATQTALTDPASVEQTWPYCEVFVPTVVALAGMTIAPADRFLDTSLLRRRPFVDLADPRLTQHRGIAHPVLAGTRLAAARAADETHAATPTPSHPAKEATFMSATTPQLPATSHPGAPQPAAPSPAASSPELVDLARNRPATQSSRSEHSSGTTAADDAGRANSGPLADDFAFHTGYEKNPWWQVDLGAPLTVSHLVLVNRRSYDRFRHFAMAISRDGADWQVVMQKLDDTPVPADPAQPGSYALTAPVEARYVRVVLAGTDYLHLRRIGVLGPAAQAAAIPPTTTVLTTPTAQIAAHTAAVPAAPAAAYDLDDFTGLAAATDAALYVARHMSAAQRCAGAASLLALAAGLVPATGMIVAVGEAGGQRDTLSRLLPGRPIEAVAAAGPVDAALAGLIAAHRQDPIALLTLDSGPDLALPGAARTIFSCLDGKLGPGTVLLFGAYLNHRHWRMGEYKAFQDFLAWRNLRASYLGLVPTGGQVAARIEGG